MANDRHSYVEFYPSDWMAGTAYMPPLCEWLYLQICLYNWDKREPVPIAQAALRFSRSPSWEADLAILIEAGKVVRTAGGGLFVERALVAANKAYELWEKKSRGGRNRKSAPDQGEPQESSKTHGKSHRSNQNQNQNQTFPDGKDPPAPQGGEPPVGDLIFAVPAEALANFRAHRVKIKKPMTAHAEGLLIKKLEKIWQATGQDPTAVIDYAIYKGWAGVFAIKDEADGRGNQAGRASGPDRRDGFTRAVHDEAFGDDDPERGPSS